MATSRPHRVEAPDEGPSPPGPAKGEGTPPPPTASKPTRLWHRRWFWIGLGVLVGLLVISVIPFDGALRGRLEAKMNQSLKGYSVQLGGAEASLFGLNLTLHDVVFRQSAFPEPPVAVIPRLKFRLEWTALFAGHLVGDAFFEQPHLHLNVAQLHQETLRKDRLGERGWQAALESIYPLKFNRFRVDDGSIGYLNNDPQRPLEITHWNLEASNIRNLQFPDRVYPSPVHTEGQVFGTGYASIDGHANFLSEPFPGVHAIYRVRNVPLDRLEQLSRTYELHRGTLTSTGEVEYAPRFKLVDVADVVLDGVQLDYVHTSATEASEREHGERIAAAARQAEVSPVVMRLDRLRLLNGSVGFVNRATDPPYRLYVDRANMSMLHISNRAAELRKEPASIELHGRLVGSGTAVVRARFRSGSPSSDFNGELAVEKASLPALNDMLRAYKKLDVAAGTVSVYLQIAIENGKISGYVKPLFEDIRVSDPEKDKDKPLGAKVKEKLVGGLAHLLASHTTKAVATRTELSGTVNAPQSNIGEIVNGLLRNAFLKAILPGFEGATRPSHQR